MPNPVTGTGQRGYHPMRKVLIMIRGLRVAAADPAVAWKLIVSLLLLIGAIGFYEWLDVFLLLLATATMLVAELLNTAIEGVCDFIQKEHHPDIKRIKDIAAGAVGISVLAWFAIVGYEAFMVGEALRHIFFS